MSSPAPVVANNNAHLAALIGGAIKRDGPLCDLNHIDVSGIEDFAAIFEQWPSFNGDISRWNTSFALSMYRMFCTSEFEGDISQWNTSKVTDMAKMFQSAKFNGDISKWDVSNTVDMRSMFQGSNFNGDISKWNVQKVENFANMFAGGVFAHDISAWPLQKGAQLPSFYQGNSLFLAAQSMEPWIIWLHLKNEAIPTIPEWEKAFANVQALALSLDLTTAQHVAAIVEAHSFIVQSVNPVGYRETPVDNAVFEAQSFPA